jgi:hypothetical protein
MAHLGACALEARAQHFRGSIGKKQPPQKAPGMAANILNP